MIDALIFDFDGLILDTEVADYLSWKETFAELGCELSLDVWCSYIGTTGFDVYGYLETLLDRPVDRQAIQARRKQRDNEMIAAQTIMPGVTAYLAQARELGLKVGLASSSAHDWVDRHLQRLELFDRFDVIFCCDDVNGLGKPNPAVYLAAVRALAVAPSAALALEDSPHGVSAAKAAGLWCTAVPNTMTRSLNFDHADYRLGSLAELPLKTLIAEVTNHALE